MILCTHKHADHVGGNSLLKKQFPDIEIVGPVYEPIPEITRSVKDNDEFFFGS
jgi:hydroxyacylglutathione hydrolase